MRRRAKESITKLEKEGKFDEDFTLYMKNNFRKIDPNYKYLPTSFLFCAGSFLSRCLIFVIGPIVNFWVYGLKIKGKQNLKKIKGRAIISVSNHVFALDCLPIFQCYKTRKVYITAGEGQYKKGLLGAIIKAGGMLPLSSNPRVMINFDKALKEIIQKKGIVHFYPEHALWTFYEKPRPLKIGAFHYAAKYNLPVVPVFFTFKVSCKFAKMLGRKINVTAHILEPIEDKLEKTTKDKQKYLLESCEKLFQDCYNNYYKKEE